MAGIPVVGTGPIAVTEGGRHLTIPLGMLGFVDGAINADAWPLYKGKVKAVVDPWLNYLVRQQSLVSAGVAVGPAFKLEAARAGSSGNAISVDITAVESGNPKSQSKVTADVKFVEVYAGLTTGSIAEALGTSGLAQVESVVAAEKVPANGTTTLLPAGTPIEIKDSAGAVVFKLAAPSDSGGPTTLAVTVVADPAPPPPAPDPDEEDPPPPPAPKFTLTMNWEKTAEVKLADFNTQFGHIVVCTPPGSGLAHDPALGKTTLSGGADATDDTTAVKASGVVASA